MEPEPDETEWDTFPQVKAAALGTGLALVTLIGVAPGVAADGAGSGDRSQAGRAQAVPGPVEARVAAGPMQAATPRARARQGQQVTFYWGLARPESAAESRVAAVSTPGSGSYRHFQAPDTVARKFGARASTVRTVSRYARSLGLRPHLDRSRLFLRVTGRVRDFRRAFHVDFGSYVNAGFQIVEPNSVPLLANEISGLITEPIWSSQTQTKTKTQTKTRSRASSVRSVRDANPPVNTGTMIRACPKAKRRQGALQNVSVGQISVAYGSAVVAGPRPARRGRRDRGPELGIVSEGSGFSDRLLRLALKCFDAKGSAVRVETDGMTGPEPHEVAGEADLDVQASLEVLSRGGSIAVYEASENDPGMFLPMAAALNAANPPKVLSTSYGECEPYLNPAVRSLADALYKRLALVGTSALAAAGDSGSSDCWNSGGGPTDAAVDYPGSSPWVTSVGGSRLVLNADNTRQSEVAWNDTAWAGSPLAGGGGWSQVYPRPAWQSADISGSPWRAVPDLSAHASGYPAFPQVIAQGRGEFVQGQSGTSFAAPVVSASIALINRRLARNGQPSLGLLNPWLYQLPAGALYDITSGTNDLFGVGCCDAGIGYDQATGLGSPNFATLYHSTVKPD